MENEEKKTHIFKKKNTEDSDVWNTHLCVTFYFGHGCLASHVVSDTPPPPWYRSVKWYNGQ